MCYSIECEPLVAYDFISDDCNGKLLDESCTAQCAAGFEYVGGSSAQQLTCLNDAEFHVALQGNIPDCQRRACDSSSLQGDDVQDNCADKVFGETCTQWCAPGYLPGNVTLTCSMYGTFSGDWLDCKRAPLNTTAAAVESVATIAGLVELDVDDPQAFINDANALRVLRNSLADIAGVPEDYVELTARELNGTVTSSSTTTQMTTSDSTTAARRRLFGGNVIISFVIRVPSSDAVASAKLVNGTMEASIRGTNAVVVLTQLLTGSPIFTVYSATIQDIDIARASETTPPTPSDNRSSGKAIPQGALISGIVVSVILLVLLSCGVCAYVVGRKTGGGGKDTGSKDASKDAEEASEDTSPSSETRAADAEEGEVCCLDDLLAMDCEGDCFSVDDFSNSGNAPPRVETSAMVTMASGDLLSLNEFLDNGQSFRLDDCLRVVSSPQQASHAEGNQQFSSDSAAGMNPRSAQGKDLSSTVSPCGIGDGQHLSLDSAVEDAPPSVGTVTLRHSRNEQLNSVASVEWIGGEDELVMAI